jgi:glutaredoxin
MFLAIILVALQVDRLEVYTHPTCPPCKRFAREYAANPKLTLGIPTEVIRIDQERERAKERDVWIVPTFIAYSGDRELGRATGYSSPESLQRWLESQ